MGREINQFNSDTAGLSLIAYSSGREHGRIFLDLLAALCLFLLIMGILQQLTGFFCGSYGRYAAQAELHYSARMALDCIEKDLRCARDFQVSADGSKLVITDAKDQNIRIFVRNANLYRQDVSSIPVAENMSAVHFIKKGDGLLVQLKLTDGQNSFRLDFFCYARALKDQGEWVS